MTSPLATVFGGSGFIGRYVVQRLARHGYRVRVAVRNPSLALFLKPLGAVGQIQIVHTDIKNEESCKKALQGADVAVNLVGVLYPSGRQTFDNIHETGAAHIAKAAQSAGVKTLVHLSAIGADAQSPSSYAVSKAKGEAAICQAFPNATILRPSIVFGPEDNFTNRFAALGRRLPFMPVICGDTRFQPVYVGDVADAVMAVIDAGKQAQGQIYELGGPTQYSFRALLQLIMKEAMIRRPLVDIPLPLARLQASVMQILPKPPITPDQLILLKRDNVVADSALTLQTLGITPTPAEAILPAYLRRYRPKGQFSGPAEED